MNYPDQRVCSFDNLEFALERLWYKNKDLIITRRIDSAHTLVQEEQLTTYHFFTTVLIEDSKLNKKYKPLTIQCNFFSPGESIIQKPFIEFENMQYFLDQLEEWFGFDTINGLFGDDGVVYHPRPEDSLYSMKMIKVKTWESH